MNEQTTFLTADADDSWHYYHTALAHPDWIGTEKLPIHDGQPQQGYYRVRLKGGDWQPVAFVRDPESGLWWVEKNGQPVPEHKWDNLWIWCCRYPVEYDDWRDATEGKGWPDQPEHAPTIGDNIREADPAEALRIEFYGERELVLEFLKEPIKTKDDADRAGIWAKRLTDIAARANAQHKVEKAPALAETQRIDERWRELREEPADLSKRLKAHSKAYLDELDRQERLRVEAGQREAERLRRAAQIAARQAAQESERAAAEARRLEQEARAQSDAEAGLAKQEEAERIRRESDQRMVEAGALVSQARAAEREAEYRNPQAGRTGAKIKLVTYTSARIDDIEALWGALKERGEVIELFQTLADRAARGGVALAGCTIVKERRPA
jgi:hypothetical protein